MRCLYNAGIGLCCYLCKEEEEEEAKPVPPAQLIQLSDLRLPDSALPAENYSQPENGGVAVDTAAAVQQQDITINTQPVCPLPSLLCIALNCIGDAMQCNEMLIEQAVSASPTLAQPSTPVCPVLSSVLSVLLAC